MNMNAIVITQGDTALLNLFAEDGNGGPINLTGATFTTYILSAGGVVASFPDDQHTITDAELGEFSLELSADDTTACGLGANKDIITRIVQGSSTIYYRGNGILTVYPPVPLQ